MFGWLKEKLRIMSLKAFDLSLPFIIIFFIDTDGCFHDPVAVGGDQGGILEFWVI